MSNTVYNSNEYEEAGESILREILEMEEVEEFIDRELSKTREPSVPEGPEEGRKKQETEHSQWAVQANGQFVPVGKTVGRLEPGVYSPFAIPGIFGVERMSVSSDGIYNLPDMATEEVLKEVEKFWGSEQKYRDHNLLYKRGILLWGPPGSGKTVTVKMLMNELIKREGIVIIVQNVGIALVVLKALRRIEPKRNLITLFEDIDEIINFSGESAVLSMLDGEHNIDNLLQLATTNYPERLGARIVNRPSRFDRRVYVGYPEVPARKSYIEQATKNGLSESELNQWVADTKEMSIAHLRELVAAVYCLEQPYQEVLKRLRDMQVEVKNNDTGFTKARGMGYGGKAPQSSPW